jgi:Xaa-Pro aminopeptidase
MCEPLHSKVERVREALTKKGADATVVSALDQIAWLFNLRGSDIEFNPVFFAYAALTSNRVMLFLREMDEGRGGIKAAVSQYLFAIGVEVFPYQKFFDEVPHVLSGKRVLLEPCSASLALFSLVPQEHRVKDASPVELFKAVKNEREIEGLRQSSRRDSAAICEYFAELEANFDRAVPKVFTEVTAAELLSDMRRKQPRCVGDSFQTISAVGPNSAIVHYHAEAGTCSVLERELMYLCDTGGQYEDGTTDITRTLHFGTPSEEERRCYTRVAQGHIGLAMAIFPEGTPGLMLDMLARQPLWQDGLQYGHGTGHGIGFYLNVHEGPMGIGGGSVSSATIAQSEGMKRLYLAPFQAGHFVSDEPGFYKDGAFGIRLEADLVVVPADTRFHTGARPFLRFEYLTLVPFCRRLLDLTLLSPVERAWIDTYHSRVRDELLGCLSETAAAWLRQATEPL